MASGIYYIFEMVISSDWLLVVVVHQSATHTYIYKVQIPTPKWYYFCYQL